MSSAGGRLVSWFSLLSSSTNVEAAEAEAASAIPWFEAGVVTHPCTSEVTSTRITVSACVTAIGEPTTAPNVGAELNVTESSFHAVVTGFKSSAPAVFTRFTYKRSVAEAIPPEVVPAGSDPRLNWISAMFPLPTARFVKLPKFVLGCALLMCASLTSGASVARAVNASKMVRKSPTATALPLHSSACFFMYALPLFYQSAAARKP
jgi:hypothetical protein